MAPVVPVQELDPLSPGTLIPEIDAIFDPSTVIPLLRPREAIHRFRDQTPNDPPVSEPWVADLHILYASEFQHAFRHVMSRELVAAGLTLPELRDRAMSNLRTRLPEVRINSTYVVVPEPNLTASTLLLDWFWAGFAAHIGGPVIVAVPHRDVVFVARAEDPDGAPFLRRIIEAARQDNSRSLLTDRLLVWNENGWDELMP